MPNVMLALPQSVADAHYLTADWPSTQLGRLSSLSIAARVVSDINRLTHCLIGCHVSETQSPRYRVLLNVMTGAGTTCVLLPN